jgi:hypothetical protein
MDSSEEDNHQQAAAHQAGAGAGAASQPRIANSALPATASWCVIR